MASRRYELTVHGATGFTGRQALLYLATRAAELDLRWAVAGRNEERLAGLVAGLPEPRPAIAVADATDAEALASLAADTTAMVSFLGPYAPLGDVLPEQCVAAGTHYADLCGENDVIADRIVKFGASARQAGVRLVSACAYESVPFDLGVLGLDQAFRLADGSRLKRADAEVRFLFHRSPLRYGHGNSGGTFASVTRLVEDPGLTDAQRFARAAGAASPPAGGSQLDLQAQRSSNGDWLSPLMPSPFLNPAMMHLTSTLLAEDIGGYSADFTYQEVLNTSASLGSSLIAAPAAKASSALVRRIAAMSKGRRNFGDRAVLAAFKALTPKPGNGPSLDTLDTLDYRIDLRGRSASGLYMDGSVRAKGHPGYRSSANILAEAGIALCRGDSLPERSGVLTPAAALGAGFIDPLSRAGVSFDFGVPQGIPAGEG